MRKQHAIHNQLFWEHESQLMGFFFFLENLQYVELQINFII